eukprot:852812-Amphidinium_carterae.1
MAPPRHLQVPPQMPLRMPEAPRTKHFQHISLNTADTTGRAQQPRSPLPPHKARVTTCQHSERQRTTTEDSATDMFSIGTGLEPNGHHVLQLKHVDLFRSITNKGIMSYSTVGLW